MRSLDSGVAGVKGRSGKTEDPLRAKSPCPTEFESLARGAFGLFSAVYSSQLTCAFLRAATSKAVRCIEGVWHKYTSSFITISIEARSLNRR